MADLVARLKVALADRYRIERELGAGGMATVYLAEDLKHQRKVAVKVFHPELAALIGAERFLAEIRTTANLQHPHILPLHDSGQADVFLFYVMPYVEGETLRARLTQDKQLPVEEALRITREVASALDYAHRHGVIHRDIKPENILLHEGRALIADFGIALAVSSAGGPRMTQTGMSLGTPEYMSPEQALGERTVSPKSDTYALGCVLYEMLTGEPPFTGATVQAVVARVMSEEPRPIGGIRKTVPPHVEAACLQALSKLPADRPTPVELVAALGDPRFGTTGRPTGSGSSRPRAQRATALLALSTVVFAAVAVAGWLRSPGLAESGVRYVPVALEAPFRTRQAWAITAKLSPDGRLVAYHGDGGRLYVLDMSTGTTRPLSADLPAAQSFAFSPGSDSVVFRTAAWMGTLVAASLVSGQGRMIADSALSHEPAWSNDGWIYYGDLAGGLSRVRSDGSRREVVLARDSLDGLRVGGSIEPLPGGRGVVYGLVPLETRPVGGGEIEALDFTSGQRVRLGRGTKALYARTGHLLLLQADGSLLAAPFDLNALRSTASFTKVLDSVESKAGFYIDGAVSLADDGDLLYIAAAPWPEDEIVRLDRAGRQLAGPVGADGWVVSLSLSPRGEQVAASIHHAELGATPNIWTSVLGSEDWRRVTFGNVVDYSPRFIANGSEIAFVSPRGGRNWDIYAVPVDGAREPETILDRPGDIQDPEFGLGDQWVAFCERDVNGQVDLLAHRFGPDSTTVVLAATPGAECQPALSPDGRWLAYASNESGRNEVYVTPFPGGGTRWQVSTQGASGPRWSHRGDEVIFRSASGAVVSLPVGRGGTFTFGAPRVLFDASGLGWMRATTPDDQGFLMVRRELRAPGRVVLVRNWTSQLSELGPGR